MSRLEAYRKQAKQLVRWHRAGHYSVAGRIRGLPRYAQLTDAQALALEFPLAAAQEIIAREAGFESWAALKAAVGESPSRRPREPGANGPSGRPREPGVNGPSGQPREPGVSAPSIKAAIPVIFVSNVGSAAEFFRDRLGFAIDFLHGQPPFYGGVSRDGATLHLRLVHEPVVTSTRRQNEQLLAAFIAVENIKGLFEEYKLKDVPFAAVLHKEPWGGPTFTVSDPDGNWICFCAAS